MLFSISFQEYQNKGFPHHKSGKKWRIFIDNIFFHLINNVVMSPEEEEEEEEEEKEEPCDL